MTEPNNSKTKLITLKIYFDRAKMYLGYINFFILNIVLINSIENEYIKEIIDHYKWVALPVLSILYVLILLGIGYLDNRLGLRQEELRNNATKNPVQQEILLIIRDIQDKVTQLEGNSTSKTQ